MPYKNASLHTRGQGNASRYKQGCRCHECRSAHAHETLAWVRRNPEKRHATRHASCPECGGEMSWGNGNGRNPSTCQDCRNAAIEPKHGSWVRYNSKKHACRCAECRTAWAAYVRAYNARRRAAA